MSLTEEVWPRTGRDPRRDDLPGILALRSPAVSWWCTSSWRAKPLPVNERIRSLLRVPARAIQAVQAAFIARLPRIGRRFAFPRDLGVRGHVARHLHFAVFSH